MLTRTHPEYPNPAAEPQSFFRTGLEVEYVRARDKISDGFTLCHYARGARFKAQEMITLFGRRPIVFYRAF